MGEITVGLDIGTTSIKAVAVAADGTVAARARIPHEVRVPEPECLEHDARRAWWRNPRRALSQLHATEPRAIAVAGDGALARGRRRGRPADDAGPAVRRPPGARRRRRAGGRGRRRTERRGRGLSALDRRASSRRGGLLAGAGRGQPLPRRPSRRSISRSPSRHRRFSGQRAGTRSWYGECGASPAQLADVELPGAAGRPPRR